MSLMLSPCIKSISIFKHSFSQQQQGILRHTSPQSKRTRVNRNLWQIMGGIADRGWQAGHTEPALIILLTKVCLQDLNLLVMQQLDVHCITLSSWVSVIVERGHCGTVKIEFVCIER